MIITGQALDRATDLPVANAALKIGFATRGYRWYRDILTDAAGNYRYEDEPSVGFGGTLSLWAAHPLVFDQLNQAQVTIYRLYATPQRGDIRMSKNDSLEFSLSLINPGDTPLTGFVGSFRAYRMEGTNEVAEANLSGVVDVPEDFSLAPGQTRGINLRLFATASAPDNAIVEYTIRSAEGAAAVFQGNVTLLPAVPVVTVIDPRAGYLEVSVDRGNQVSRSITVVNRGHRDLQGVELVPPADIAWMAVNLPAGQDGKIHLPDLKVGESNSFLVVFTPPAGTALDYFQDTLQIKGTNAAAPFTINVYARVTSDQNGNVQFFVDNILSQDVPNATVRLRNTHLQIELPPVYTDENGLVTVTNLQEGVWSWRVEAPGHSANVGLVEVIPGQTIRVDTRLNKSVVTISFSVVPVPYTDRYEIKLEQTFETHVPVPVLVLDPTYKEFNNVQPGFEANFIVTAKNYGLIQMENLTIKGSQSDHSTFTPLITYVPVLRPQEVIEIPFRVTYSGTNGLTQQGNPLVDCLPNPFGGFDDIIPFTEGLRAIANAEGRCVRDNTALMIAGAVALTMKIVQDVTGVFASVGEQVASYIGCVIGSLLAGMGDSGSSSGPAASNGQQSVQNFGPTGPSCFVADTVVWMADGTHKPIQQVKVGDWVRSGLKTNDVAMVTDTFERTVRQVRTLVFDQPSARTRIESTDEHLFWVDGKGWTAAWALHPGDWLTTEQGVPLPVASSAPRQESVSVYTFKLREDTAFFANGVLVHDLCGAEWSQTVAGGAR